MMITQADLDSLSPLETAALAFCAMGEARGFDKIHAAEVYGSAVYNVLTDLNERVKKLEEKIAVLRDMDNRLIRVEEVCGFLE